MRVLVTGGAGYIGSIVTEELLKLGHSVVVVDNLSHGHRDAVSAEAELVVADIGDVVLMNGVFTKKQVDAVMHFAGDSLVGVSMTDPAVFFRNNVASGITLFETMFRHDVKKIVFSSSAAVYGEPVRTPIQETDPQTPVNPYGDTKLVFEKILTWYGKAYGLRHISLRYFNAAGASERHGEDHRPETHLIPNVLKAVRDKDGLVQIFGTDYSTPDGSCVRDYVHVRDIAAAHVLALTKLESLQAGVFNLGNGQGYSVLEVVKAAEKVVGKKVPVKLSPRRPGDPAVLVASSGRAVRDLGWKPKFPDLESMVESAWNWVSKHRNGYDK